jgi:hypothetical protein
MKKLLFALAITLFAGLADAATPSWTERARDAALQVVGRCDSRSSRWEGGGIYSYCEVSVLQVLRGVADPSLVVRQRGGEVDGIAQKVSHVTMMEPGQTYLLFLGRDDTGSWSPTSKGVNPVLETSDLGETVDGQPLEEIVRELGSAN